MVFFENALALNDFSMNINQGEIVGVIGSNSAGKTTLMNTISGLIIDMKIKEQRKGGERITTYGEIIFQGEDITETQPFERVKKGLVLSRERHPIFPESDVAENLKIAGHDVKKSELAARMDYAYTLFPALVNLKQRKAGFLSGGEQQMLAVAMALIPKPSLLLLDEPLLGLSPMMQKIFARPILPMIDRGYVIENGMLALFGTGMELMDNPEVKSAYFGV
jgi:branched-chain amino acid transport system ATP-binding protein